VLVCVDEGVWKWKSEKLMIGAIAWLVILTLVVVIFIIVLIILSVILTKQRRQLDSQITKAQVEAYVH